MNSDKTIVFTITILCFVISIPAALCFRKMPATELLPSEKMFVNFTSVPVAVFAPKQQPAFSGFDCPVKPPAKLPAKSLPPTAPDIMKVPVKPPKVSMIYFEDNATKKAIIDGQILKVGSAFGANTVVKIEETRVQIRSFGKDIWLNMP